MPTLMSRTWRKVNEPEPEEEPPEEGTIHNPFVWEQNQSYEIDDYVTDEGVLYKVIQEHTSGHWAPSFVPALYEVVGD